MSLRDDLQEVVRWLADLTAPATEPAQDPLSKQDWELVHDAVERATASLLAAQAALQETSSDPAMLAAGSPSIRTITMDYTRQSLPTSTFNFAVASKGSVSISGGSITAVDPSNNSLASVMSASPISGSINMSKGTIGGDLNVVSGATAYVKKGTVGGESDTSLIQQDHVHTVNNPEFPTVDTSVYEQYATNTYQSGVKVQKNIRVPAGTNPTFNANDTVQGIIYVESPNQVTFNGDNGSNTAWQSFDNQVTPAPEPATYGALLAAAAATIVLWRRRRSSQLRPSVDRLR